MSIKRMVAVWELSNHSEAALLLLLAIADYADENGLAWPGMATLARKTRLYRGSVARIIDRLCASGELLALNRDRQRSNLYVVTPGLTAEQLADAIERARDMGATSTRGKDDLSVPEAVREVVSQGVHLRQEVVSQGVQVVSQGVQVVSQGVQGSLPGRHDPSLSVIDPSGNRQDLSSQEISILWEQILTDLKGQLAPETFNGHLLGSKVYAVDNGVWWVRVRHGFSLPWLEEGTGLRDRIIARTVERYAPGVTLEFVAKEEGG